MKTRLRGSKGVFFAYVKNVLWEKLLLDYFKEFGFTKRGVGHQRSLSSLLFAHVGLFKNFRVSRR